MRWYNNYGDIEMDLNMGQDDLNLRILIIDDSPDIRRDFIKILTTESAGDDAELENLARNIFDENENVGASKNPEKLPRFEIDLASQGQEGVEKIANSLRKNTPYALAFVGVRMSPGWDGIETIKHIWALDPNIQVVICTAYSGYSWEETVGHLRQKENLFILKKPFDAISVRQLSVALTKKWQLLKEVQRYTQSLEALVEERTNSLNQSLMQRVLLEEKIQYQATHDALTGLPNRLVLFERAKCVLAESQRNSTMFGILFINLDRFKLINDSFNHAIGDKLLQHISNRLQSSIRTEDTLVRFGGDEFVILTNNLKKLEDAKQLSMKILAIFAEPFTLAEHTLTLSASIGVSVYPRDGHNINELLRNADAAMYSAKISGSDQYQFYTKDLDKKNLALLEISTELTHALKSNEFFLYYQPQFDLKTGELVSFEALIRWQHPQKGMLLPIDFIPIAEETGLIIPIGEWVLREACRQNKQWQKQGFQKVRIAVNIAMKQCKLPDFTKIIKNILSETGLSPEYLELELTENLISNPEVMNIAREIKKLGVQITLDDFGTGSSALNYLRETSIDRIKIDKSYVQNFASKRGDNIIIQAIITMAKGLNLDVLAEGVETQEQLEFLKTEKCGEVAGFYFNKPLLAADCEQLLSGHEKVSFLKLSKK